MSQLPAGVIDVDGHINEKRVDWAARLPAGLRHLAPRVVGGYEAGGERFMCGDRYVPEDDEIGLREPGLAAHHDDRYWVNREGMFEPQARLADMDTEGIDVAVLFGGPIGVVTLSCLTDPTLSQALARAYNDWLIEDYCGVAPARLKGVAALPMQDPQAAAIEVERARERGHAAVMTMAHIHKKPLHHPDFDRVWAAAEACDMPVCVHIRPTETVGSELFERYVLKRPFAALDLMTAITSFCLGGILDRFPRLRVGFMEGGTGWIPWFTHRLQESYELYPAGYSWVQEEPLPRLRSERIYFSIEPNDPFLPSAIEALGAEHFMYSSDYSHPDCICPETVRTLAARDDVSAADKKLLFRENADRFLGLRVPATT